MHNGAITLAKINYLKNFERSFYIGTRNMSTQKEYKPDTMLNKKKSERVRQM